MSERARGCSLLLLLSTVCVSQFAVLADDSAQAPQLDLTTLASLASNIGSNPQLMSMVTSLLTPKSAPSAAGQPPDLSQVPEQDISAAPEIKPTQQVSSEPLKRGVRQQMTASATSTTSSRDQQPIPAGPQPSNALSGLSSILSLGLSKQSGSIPARTPSEMPPTETNANQPPPVSVPRPPPTQSAGPSSSANPSNPAQTVINQVLSAYVAGQIPNELIQLALSGRVPPQIIELALSGQVPPQMIQMIITGQVPMSTINAFLGAMQVAEQARATPPRITTTATTPTQGSLIASQPAQAANGGVFATTRSLFETLFGLSRRDPNAKTNSLNVPTLLGPFPIKIPSFPNVRNLGQLFGGTITNMASLIPF